MQQLSVDQVDRILEQTMMTCDLDPSVGVDHVYIQSFLLRYRHQLRERLELALQDAGLLTVDEPDDPTCPYCGEDLDLDGLDVRLDSAGARWVDWMPCCYDLRDEVAELGWEAVFGRSLEDSLRGWFLAPDVHSVDEDDSLILASLTAKAPGPGTKGWQARVFQDIEAHHLHHKPPVGWKFGVAVWNGMARVGVAVVGRPVSRRLQEAEPGTLEVTRICTWGDPRLRRNAVTKLLGQCRKEARKLGATKLITYTLEAEGGSSLKAAGFTPVAFTRGGSWDRPGRRRSATAPTGRKVRWETRL